MAELLGPLKGRLRHYSADGDVTAVGKALEAGAAPYTRRAGSRAALGGGRPRTGGEEGGSARGCGSPGDRGPTRR